jgi:hypothetical protein
MKQVPFFLMFCLVFAFVVTGCVQPAAPSRAGNSSAFSGVGRSTDAPSVAEGTVASPIAVEEGFLRLDLSDGTRMEFMTDDAVVSMDSLLRSAGKKCRVYYKDSFYEDIEGDRSPALQMTKIEWL